MPFFSVVIPTYNRADLIAETLESIAGQQYRDFETIVVDDGSTDRTCEIVESFPFVRLVRQENSGPGTARNRAAALATGKYLAFIDSDDVWFPWTLSTYADVIESNGSPTFVAGMPKIFIETHELSAIAAEEPQFTFFKDYLASGDEWRWFGVSSFVIDTAAFRSIGGFRPGCVNGEDAELTLRMGCLPGFVQITTPPTFGYRTHASNVTSDTAKTLEGIADLIEGERAGRFPGGNQRKSERRRIITRLARPWVVAAIKEKRWDVGWKVYRDSFVWELIEGRAKFLLGTLLLAALSIVSRPKQPGSPSMSPSRIS